MIVGLPVGLHSGATHWNNSMENNSILFEIELYFTILVKYSDAYCDCAIQLRNVFLVSKSTSHPRTITSRMINFMFNIDIFE